MLSAVNGTFFDGSLQLKFYFFIRCECFVVWKLCCCMLRYNSTLELVVIWFFSDFQERSGGPVVTVNLGPWDPKSPIQ